MSVVSTPHAEVVLPPRYSAGWRELFDDRVSTALRPGITVLDVGSGRNPTISPADRPTNVWYVGLDASAHELAAAGSDAYNDLIVADVATPIPRLSRSVDLVVSWQVFEHVKPLKQALNNLHEYLKPGGTLVSLFSGRWSVFGVVNQLMPDVLGHRLVERTMRRRCSTQPVFRAHYDQCSYRALRLITNRWTDVEIVPLYRGANYFHFSKLATNAYLIYENSVCRSERKNLATHYLLVARS
jgi:SAM-dependent methyltransferase